MSKDPNRIIALVLPTEPTVEELLSHHASLLRPRQIFWSRDHPSAFFFSYSNEADAEKAMESGESHLAVCSLDTSPSPES